MKRKLKIIICASAASVLTFAALAQYPIVPSADQPDHTRDRRVNPRTERLSGAVKASDLLGMKVANYQGEKLGKVADLEMDVESGRIIQVIVSTGGFIGMGDALRAVPPGALHHDVAQRVLHLNASKEKLKGAPKFDKVKRAAGIQSPQLSDVYAYYDQQPYFPANRIGAALSPADLKYAQTLPRNMDGTLNTTGTSSVERVRNAEIARKLAENYNMRSTQNPDGTWTREYYLNGSETSSSWSGLGYIQKASKLIGMSVNNRQDEKLGDVKNLMVDLSSGRIIAVIISSGGFIGMGDELSPIPPTALRFTPDRSTLQLDASKETLSQSPHFKANQWPDFNQSNYADGVYRAYNTQPNFISDTTTDADNTRRQVRDRDDRKSETTPPDNTARNVRDRDDRALTPLDQGNSQADVATTAQIRKEIIAGKNLSVNAQNVKIITKDGLVTLRGPVNDVEEKRLIGEIAERSANAREVDNQLEVKSAPISND